MRPHTRVYAGRCLYVRTYVSGRVGTFWCRAFTFYSNQPARALADYLRNARPRFDCYSLKYTRVVTRGLDLEAEVVLTKFLGSERLAAQTVADIKEVRFSVHSSAHASFCASACVRLCVYECVYGFVCAICWCD